MNRHQVLTGAANNFDYSTSIGSVENNYFTAYGSGSKLVILSSNFERIQIISSKSSNSNLRCVECTNETGKIAVAVDKIVYIYEPTPSKKVSSLSYKWMKIGCIRFESDVLCLSWNVDNNRLLISLKNGAIQIWSYNSNLSSHHKNQDVFSNCKKLGEQPVKFSIDEESEDKINDENNDKFEENKDDIDHPQALLHKIWEKRLSSPAKYVKYSPDGLLFASLGENDRNVKVWQEVRSLSNLSLNSEIDSKLIVDYDSIYLSHPRAVTGISWRKISNYLPKGVISNSLLTSCKDNVCRIWSETVISDDGLTYSMQEESSYTSIDNKSVRHKKNFLNKLHKISSHLSLSKHHSHTSVHHSEGIELPRLIHNSLSCNELFNNKYNYHSLASRLHFHLAGFVEIDFSMFSNNANVDQAKFIVHWMNNKELNFNIASEAFFNEIIEKLKKEKESNNNQEASDNEDIDIEIDAKEKGKEYSDQKSVLSQVMDHKLDKIIKDWYSSQDLLFCIHPLDGSILIWLVDWLDEYLPGNYRQPLVSFHAKLPNAISIGDAMSLTNSVFLYSQQMQLFSAATQTYINEKRSNNNASISSLPEKCQKLCIKKPEFHMFSGIINMVSKHNNGTLNLWRLQFQENSQYQSLINITHLSRTCGHRLHVSDISSHPVLPFLLTNSINEPEECENEKDEPSNFFNYTDSKEKHVEPVKSKSYLKGIIIWGVNPVGPLNITGGIYELARVDSMKENAFENIAWFPCFLPSFTLGNSSSSPSTLFVSTDCSGITIYQAVFDARTLLHDIKNHKSTFPTSATERLIKLRNKYESTFSSNSSVSNITDIGYDNFNVISIQSTARPGCIIELEKIADSDENWNKADLYHVYQEDLISKKSHQNQKEANSNQQFNEVYFLVLLEKKKIDELTYREIVHMWKIIVTSSPIFENNMASGVSSDPIVDEMINSTKVFSSFSNENLAGSMGQKNRLTITSTKVCRQELYLPSGVYVVSADSAAADLSSSSMFTSSQVPYLFSTACSDGIIRFWSCKDLKSECAFSFNSENDLNANQFSFFEWELNSTIADAKVINHTKTNTDTIESYVNINNFPLALSCSYNGRFAVAYKKENTGKQDPSFFVEIYECESTGGSGWKLEDILCLENIVLPKIKIGINFDYIYGSQKPIKPSRSSHSFKNILLNQYNHNINTTNLNSTNDPEIPSAATRRSIKKKYREKDLCHWVHTDDDLNSDFNPVKLDWASTENGSHILMVCLANQIFVYSCVKKESPSVLTPYASKSISASSSAGSTYKPGFICDDSNNVPINQNQFVSTSSSFMDSVKTNSVVEWVRMRSFTLDSADDMQALPKQVKWVRDGLLVVGLSTEMQVYSQWSPLSTNKQLFNISNENNHSKDNINDNHSIIIPKNHSVLDLAKLNKLTSEQIKLTKVINKEEIDEANSEFEKENKNTKVYNENKLLEIIQDSGIFVQAATQFPTLPQYHPKQLLELMNSGKINRVKAILMHLTRCIIDCELNKKVNVQTKLQRKISICSESEIPEEQVLNYFEIGSIPPLPLFALFAADDDNEEDVISKENKSEDSNSIFAAAKKAKNTIHDDLDIDEFQMGFNDDDDDDEKKKILQEKKLAKETFEFKKNLLSEIYSTNNAVYFNSKVCKILIDYLQYVQLDGINSVDQIHLIALADTAANIKCDVTFNQQNDIFSRKKFMCQQKSTDIQDGDENFDENSQNLSPTVDTCGFKFLVALRSYNYLIRTLPSVDREVLKKVGLGSSVYTWAFHSECQQELLDAIIHSNTNLTSLSEENKTPILNWSVLRQYGVGWWLRNPILIKNLIERVAKCAFQLNNDPLDAAIFYLAMKKKTILVALFKTVKDTKMMDFFKNDFTQSKYQSIALKNAFVLLGKQRFEHATAFFLLAGRLKDAIEVCIRNLKDIQLAIIIIRLFETDVEQASTIITAILSVENLGYSITSADSTRLYSNEQKTNVNDYISKTIDKQKCCSDPFKRSMSYWFLKEYKQALNTLYEIDFTNMFDGSLSTDKNGNLDQQFENSISQVFNFYTFLKNHPLVIRQLIVEDRRKSLGENLFFSTESTTKKGLLFNKNYNFSNNVPNSIEDTTLTLKTIKSNDDIIVTPIERRLHFTVAYCQLINGCPLLTLDVLSKLPKYISSESSDEPKEDSKKTGYDFDFKATEPTQPVVQERAEMFDWSSGGAFSTRIVEEDFKIEFSDDDDDADDDSDSDSDVKQKNNATDMTIIESQEDKTPVKNEDHKKADEEDNSNKVVDMLAQQIKFLSCLKILIQEMSTLATGFEVIGGQLRYYLYYWLERETHILRKLGDYQYKDDMGEAIFDSNKINDLKSEDSIQEGLLHEQVLEDQKTFQAKVERINRRKEWLRSNELLLRTFLSYCSLHNAKGGGLIAIKMELSLLMQELIEDRSMKQLFQSVPMPTTIPLLSASIASSKNVIAGPIQMIKSIVTEILCSVSSIQNYCAPSIFNNSIKILTIKDLSLSLSSCVYQCLCDSDSFTEPENQVVTGMQGFSRNILYKSTHLMSGMKKKTNNLDTDNSEKKKLEVRSSPKSWPGVSNLTKLLEREQDIEAPKLKILLFESLLSVYSSLFLNAFVFYDCSTLLRLVSKEWNDQMWNKLFGGGGLTEHKYKTNSNNTKFENENDLQRMKMNAKLGHRLNSFTSQSSTSPTNSSFFNNSMKVNRNNSKTMDEEKIFVKESFVPPEISMINYFINVNQKSRHENGKKTEDFENFELSRYESDDWENEERTDSEYLNPKSYSWCLIRFALVKLSLHNITTIMDIIGVELHEIAILSPDAYEVLKSLERWTEMLKHDLNALNGPPDNYLSEYSSSFNGPKVFQYQTLLKPENTPFTDEKSTQAVRKLWHFLVSKKNLQEDFIYYIFKRKNSIPISENNFNTLRSEESTSSYDYSIISSQGLINQNHGYRIIHKDQDAIHGFCLNEKDKHVLSLCTNKEILEIDFKHLLKNSSDEENSDTDHHYENSHEARYEAGSIYDTNSLHSNRSYTVMRRNIRDVKKLASHPTLPYYLSGTNEGVVKLWHWGSSDALSSYKQVEKSYSAKITKLLFNVHGNKFGVSDMDGYLHLYQLLGCSFRSYLTLRCHKVINDFLFIDSSSLLLTIGSSNDSYVISLWDTLMPPSKSLIKSYRETDISSGTCAAYSPLNHFAYCGNRKGEVNIYDVRTHKKLQKFVASESSVKALSLDAEEYYIATGSSEGNVKVWDIRTLETIQIYHNEHSKSSLIRNVNSGVNQLHFTTDSHLLSCGAEGTLILRNLKNLH